MTENSKDRIVERIRTLRIEGVAAVVLRVPDAMEARERKQITKVLQGVLTDAFSSATILIINDSLGLTEMSDDDLETLGLQRING